MGSREQMKCIFSNLCKNIQNENSSLPRVLYKYIDIYGACKLMENLSRKYTEPYKFDDIFELSEYENVKYSISPKNAKDHLISLISFIKQSTEDFKEGEVSIDVKPDGIHIMKKENLEYSTAKSILKILPYVDEKNKYYNYKKP